MRELNTIAKSGCKKPGVQKDILGSVALCLMFVRSEAFFPIPLKEGAV